jgi:antitoxin HicB
MAPRGEIALDQHLDAPYEISLVRREEEGACTWTAQVVEFPGCEARGDTEDEALAELRDAMVQWVEDALANDRPVPPPRAANVHSGRLLVRMPPTLHSDLARAADREKISLNTLIVGILGGAVSWRQDDGAGSTLPAVGAPTASDRATGTRANLSSERLASLGMMAGIAAALLAAVLALILLGFILFG